MQKFCALIFFLCLVFQDYSFTGCTSPFGFISPYLHIPTTLRACEKLRCPSCGGIITRALSIYYFIHNFPSFVILGFIYISM